jgi:cardiolipin synthase
MDDRNYAEVLVDGHRLLPAILEDIAAATRAIHVSMFLFFRDPIGEEVAAALAQKARSGVAVRVLLNMQKTAMGDPFSTGEKEMMDRDPNVHHDPLDVGPLCEEMRASGIEVVDTNIDYDRVLPGVAPRLRSIAAQMREEIAIDDLHIDHRKIIIIDGRVAYSGGANVGAQYLHHVPFDPSKESRAEGEERAKAGLPEPWWKWHDSLTRFEGPVAQVIDQHFRDRFLLDGGAAFEPVEPVAATRPPRGVPVREARVYRNEPSPSPNEVRELYLRMIRSAERSIFIENPYLYYPAIVEALCEARRRRPELQVTLVVPAKQWNDNAFAQDAQEHHYAEYLACGIEVYEYQGRFTHLKTAVFDERFSIHGSTNMNFRSLEDDKDFELVVFVDSDELARSMLAEIRDVDVSRARRITQADVEGSFAALRVRVRDPRTLLLVSRRLL